MEEIANLFHGFSVVIQPFNLLVMVLGIVLGVIIGVLPGLGGANGIAILLPLTFSMSPTSAIIMLSCIYWGALFAGAITCVLFTFLGMPCLVATAGLDSVTGQLRLTFGFTEFLNGFDFLIAVIGLFGIGEILLTMEEGLSFRGKATGINPKVVWQTWKELPRYWMTSLRSCLI